jgi:hypothetical protein
MRRILANKKGVSEIVSYVLLISITFGIAGMVYAWLVYYVTPGEEIKCDEGIALTIRSYNYDCATKALNLSLQNRGLFDVDGYIIRLNNNSKAELGVYTLNKTGTNISTGTTLTYYYSNSSNLESNKRMMGNMTFIEVQPFTKQRGNLTVYCDNVVKQKVSCL